MQLAWSDHKCQHQKTGKLEKWFPLHGSHYRASELIAWINFVCTILGLSFQKQNRMEEETEPQI